MKKGFGGNKKGQITIFIIIGVVIIGGIILFLILRSNLNLSIIGGQSDKNPNTFMESCLEKKIGNVLENISMQGGYVNPTLYKNFKFEGEEKPIKVGYLCYSQEDYIPCVNQEPMLIKHLKNEIKSSISEEVRNCFNSLTDSLKRQAYSVDSSYNGFEIELKEREINLNLDANIVLTKSGETTQKEDIIVRIPNRIYGLAFVVQEIINMEAGKSEFNHYDSFNYPDFNIEKTKTSDSSIIYKIKHRESNDEFRFAVRGSVIPAGFYSI